MTLALAEPRLKVPSRVVSGGKEDHADENVPAVGMLRACLKGFLSAPDRKTWSCC